MALYHSLRLQKILNKFTLVGTCIVIKLQYESHVNILKSYSKVRYLDERLGYIVHSYWSFISLLILSWYVLLVIASLTSLSWETPLKVTRYSPQYDSSGFYPSINVMLINLFMFQTPDGNRFAKETRWECGSIWKDDIFPSLIQFQTLLAHLIVWQYCDFLLAFLLIIGLLLCSIKFEHPKCTLIYLIN